MSNSILSRLTDLRARYARHLWSLEVSDMDMLFKRVAMRHTQDAIEECDRQIANQEEPAGEPLQDDLDAFKREREREEGN